MEQWLKTALCSPCWTEIAYAAFDGWLNTKIISCILQGSCESVCFLFPDLLLNRRPTFAPWQQHFLPSVKELWESVENQGSFLEAQAKSSRHFHNKSLDVVPGLCTVIGWWVPESDWAEVCGCRLFKSVYWRADKCKLWSVESEVNISNLCSAVVCLTTCNIQAHSKRVFFLFVFW